MKRGKEEEEEEKEEEEEEGGKNEVESGDYRGRRERGEKYIKYKMIA